MARYVVPVVVLLALVGGYVVGQESEPAREQPAAQPPAQIIWAAPPAGQPMPAASSQVGRYVPFEDGRLLDTTNGTLYALSGDNRWKPVARVETDDATALDRWSDDIESTIASRQLELEVVKRELLTHPSGTLEAVAKQLESSIESSIKELELRGPTKSPIR